LRLNSNPRHVAEEDILDAEVAHTGERMDLTKAHHV